MAHSSAAPKLTTSAMDSGLRLVYSADPRNSFRSPTGPARLELVRAEPLRLVQAPKRRFSVRAAALIHHLLPHMPVL